jgi:hypothetical protein
MSLYPDTTCLVPSAVETSSFQDCVRRQDCEFRHRVKIYNLPLLQLAIGVFH